MFSPLEVKHISGINGRVFWPLLEGGAAEGPSPREAWGASFSGCRDCRKRGLPSVGSPTWAGGPPDAGQAGQAPWPPLTPSAGPKYPHGLLLTLSCSCPHPTLPPPTLTLKRSPQTQSDPVPPPLKTPTQGHTGMDAVLSPHAPPSTPASSLSLQYPRSQVPSCPRAFACTVPTSRNIQMSACVCSRARPAHKTSSPQPFTPALCVLVILTVIRHCFTCEYIQSVLPTSDVCPIKAVPQS